MRMAEEDQGFSPRESGELPRTSSRSWLNNIQAPFCQHCRLHSHFGDKETQIMRPSLQSIGFMLQREKSCREILMNIPYFGRKTWFAPFLSICRLRCSLAGRDGCLSPCHDGHARAVPLDEGEEVVAEEPDDRQGHLEVLFRRLRLVFEEC